MIITCVVGGLQSYAMSQGSKLGENWELYDFSYDGQWEGQYLQYGLGQLVDGKGGPVSNYFIYLKETRFMQSLIIGRLQGRLLC